MKIEIEYYVEIKEYGECDLLYRVVINSEPMPWYDDCATAIGRAFSLPTFSLPVLRAALQVKEEFAAAKLRRGNR